MNSSKFLNRIQTFPGGLRLKPVDPAVIDEYRRTMEEKVIPEIVEVLRKRRVAATKNRWRPLNG